MRPRRCLRRALLASRRVSAHALKDLSSVKLPMACALAARPLEYCHSAVDFQSQQRMVGWIYFVLDLFLEVVMRRTLQKVGELCRTSLRCRTITAFVFVENPRRKSLLESSTMVGCSSECVAFVLTRPQPSLSVMQLLCSPAPAPGLCMWAQWRYLCYSRRTRRVIRNQGTARSRSGTS